MSPELAPPEATDQPAGGRRLRRIQRFRAADLDLRNTVQIMIGAIALGIGLSLMILGWNGAAHGRVEQQQIPYLISGGLIGLAIVIIGCFFYWAHWMYRIYDQADLHHQEMLREQREMMATMVEALRSPGGFASHGAGLAPAAEAAPVSSNGSARTFVATPSGTNFHTPGCPMVANRSSELRTVTEDQAGEMKPCRVCEPLVHSN